MASKLELINLALARLGANQITSEIEENAEQRTATAVWNVARRAVLRDHPWNFAIKDIELNQISDYSGFEYQHAYQLPSDCVRLLTFYGNPDFRLQGSQILTDEQVCKIKYVADIEDPSYWDAAFDDLMAQRLAHEMAYALTKSQATADSMYAIYERKLARTRFLDSTEDVLDQLGGEISNYISVRG